jgi:TrmH family RNA methyltransferase
MIQEISSLQNPKIKNIKKLEKSSARNDQQLFVVEGMKELCLAASAGYSFFQLYICSDILTQTEEYNLAMLPSEVETFEISREVYEYVAYRGSTEGVFGLLNLQEKTLDKLVLPENPLVLVIEGVEKPGNLGAMLRTADATKVDAVIVCDQRTDFFNPNVVRSSIGTVFTNQIANCSTTEAIDFLQNNNINYYAASLAAKKFYYEKDFIKPTAIVVGTEATGLTPEWTVTSENAIKIPMLGKIDSLNVSVSAAVLLYEAVRQRTF